MSKAKDNGFEGSGLTVAQRDAELDKLRELRIARNYHKKVFDKADADVKAQEQKIREIAESDGTTGRITTRNGEKYEIPEPTWYASIQDFDAFVKWAKRNQPGLLAYNKRVSQGMNQLVRGRIDDKKPLPPGLGSYPKQAIKVLGLKGEDDDGE